MGNANNWGSIHCTTGPPCGEGCVEHTDRDAQGQPYVTCFRRYATPEEGARDLLRELLRRPPVREVLSSGSATAIAQAMHRTKYFEMAPELYGQAIARNAGEISRALGEPLIVTLTGPMAEASGELLVLGVLGYLIWRGVSRRRRRG